MLRQVLTTFSKALLTLVFVFVLSVNSLAQLTAYFNWGIFNTPQNNPFIETYLTLPGKYLSTKKTKNGFQQSVNINFTLYKDTNIIKASKYNLSGPLYNDSLHPPSFIDNQRYQLPNGKYVAYIKITDNNGFNKSPFMAEENIVVNYNETEIQSSTIQLLEGYKKATVNGALTKSGFDLVPYPIDYFPETTNELAFYFETYNTAKVLGQAKPFVYSYYLQNTESGKTMSNYGAFKKQITGEVNPLLAKMDISKLGTGDYYLVIELRDENNLLLHQKKQYFRRLNQNVEIVTLQKQSEAADMAAYIGNCNKADTLKMFVECLWPIADGLDKERTINQAIKKNPTLMKQFIVDFWKRRAADTANPVKLWGAYYQQVQKVMALFKCGKMPGYYTDRGRVYLQYGAPSQRSQQTNEMNAYPYEIWHYYRLNDASNGQFFSNRRFVFVSRTLGDDCYSLIHSDVRGEINNPRWQFEIVRSSNNGIANPDNTIPAGTQNNQFNEIYNSPR